MECLLMGVVQYLIERFIRDNCSDSRVQYVFNYQSMSSRRLVVERFCEVTTIHGWSHVANARNLWVKVFWLGAIVICHALAIWAIIGNVQGFQNAGMIPIVKTNTGSLKDITFPSLTICNNNQYQVSQIQKLGVTDEDDIALLFNEFVTGRSSDLSTNQHEKLQVLKEKLRLVFGWTENDTIFPSLFRQTCSDMLIMAEWQSDKVKMFHDAYITNNDFGECCYIDPQAIFGFTEDELDSVGNNIFKLPRTMGMARSRVAMGLRFLMDVESHEYFGVGSMMLGSLGFRMGIHSFGEKLIMTQSGISIAPGNEIYLGIEPSISNTSFTALQTMTPSQRNCYDEQDNFELRHYSKELEYPYTLSLCLYESLVEKTLRDCQCNPYVYLYSKNKTICSGKGLKCHNKYLSLLADYDDEELTSAVGKDGIRRECLKPCSHEHYIPQFSFSNYPYKSSFKKRPDICYVFAKLLRVCRDPMRKAVFEEKYGDQIKCKQLEQAELNGVCKNNTFNHKDDKLFEFLYEYTKENVAHLKVYIRDPFYTLITRDVQMTMLDFVGTLGGQISLLLGFSLIGLLEVFFCILALICPRKVHE